MHTFSRSAVLLLACTCLFFFNTRAINAIANSEDTVQAPDYPSVVPTEIKGFDTTSQHIFSKPLRLNDVLKKLYPGAYYHVPDELYEGRFLNFTAWTCKRCNVRSFPGSFEENVDSFPYTEGNMTRFIDTLQYKDEQGTRHLLISFSTIPVQPLDCITCGRFQSAVLGLAMLTEVKGKWQLTNFAPYLGYYGSFQTLPKIHLIKLGRNNYGCYLSTVNGGAGGPFYGDANVLGIVNGQFRVVLSAMGVSRIGGTPSDWNVKFGNAGGPNAFEDIPVILKGIVSKAAFEADGDNPDNLPPEIQKDALATAGFHFTITRHYHFNGSTYECDYKKSTVVKK